MKRFIVALSLTALAFAAVGKASAAEPTAEQVIAEQRAVIQRANTCIDFAATVMRQSNAIELQQQQIERLTRELEAAKAKPKEEPPKK